MVRSKQRTDAIAKRRNPDARRRDDHILGCTNCALEIGRDLHAVGDANARQVPAVLALRAQSSRLFGIAGPEDHVAPGVAGQDGRQGRPP